MAEHILKELANWKLEAKFEDTERYFYFGREAQLALDGSKCFVIGRKGTGKTASIATHLQYSPRACFFGKAHL